MTVEDIATKSAFPLTPTASIGMTYREWLVGMAVGSGKDTISAINIADRTIEELTKIR